MAQETELTEPEKACEDKKPDFDELYTNLVNNLAEEKKRITKPSYTNAFEEAQTAHHTYVQCIFDFVEKKISKEGFPWFDPNQACLTQEALNKLVEDTSPNQTLPPLLSTYNSYSKHLTKLQKLYTAEGIEEYSEGGDELTAVQALIASGIVLKGIDRQITLEKENALVAMDMTFAALKELRFSFVMHVQFQCITQSLGKYRDHLLKLRTIVSGFPTKLKDASMSK